MFTTLPEELTEHIFSQIDIDDKTSLASLARVNRLGKRLATPRLYRRVRIRSSDAEIIDIVWQLKGLKLLCRTLVENRKQAELVEVIYENVGRGGEDYFKRLDNPPFSLSKCRRRLANVPEDLSRRMLIEFQRTRPGEGLRQVDSYLALLLILCTRTRFISLERAMHQPRDYPALTSTIEWLSRPDSGCSIRNINLGNGAETIDWLTMERFLKLPDLHTLSGSNVLELDHYYPDEESKAPSALQHLSLSKCTLDFHALDICLNSCLALKSLNVAWTTWSYDGTDFMPPESTLEHLPELEKLTLVFDHDSIHATRRQYDLSFRSIGSLTYLHKLKVLTVQDSILLGHTGTDDHEPSFIHALQPSLDAMLPCSLQDLTVIHGTVNIPYHIRELWRDPIVPRLKHFMLYNCQKKFCVDRRGVERYLPTDFKFDEIVPIEDFFERYLPTDFKFEEVVPIDDFFALAESQ